MPDRWHMAHGTRLALAPAPAHSPDSPQTTDEACFLFMCLRLFVFRFCVGVFMPKTGCACVLRVACLLL